MVLHGADFTGSLTEWQIDVTRLRNSWRLRHSAAESPSSSYDAAFAIAGVADCTITFGQAHHYAGGSGLAWPSEWAGVRRQWWTVSVQSHRGQREGARSAVRATGGGGGRAWGRP